MNRFALVSIAALVCIAGRLDAQSVLNLTPSRVVGQPQVTVRSNTPNVVEGREFWAPSSIVVDATANPPALYVSDFLNNRVLAWRNASSFANGSSADLVIGQVDLRSTFPQTPASGRSTGLSGPGGLAVDSGGNLYVVDTGNNRILRFPKPFAATENPRVPDFVIGQSSFSTNGANSGGAPSATSISTSSGNTAGRTGLAFDPQGNLWFTDALNHRVLRYPAPALAAGSPNGPAANLVLGQQSLTAVVQPPNISAQSRQNVSILRFPGGITTDSAGNVFVSDQLARVVVYSPPFFNGKDASRLVGLINIPAGQPLANEFSIVQAEGLFTVGDRLGVVDQAQNRILIYDAISQWPAPTTATPSPPAKIVIGQGDFLTNTPNRGQAEPSPASLSSPLGAYFSGNELFVADSGNNRVLVFSQLVIGAQAARLLGQTSYSFYAPNLVEGRELFIYNSSLGNLAEGGGVAIDNRSNPPRLYIADTFNNRVLGYADARRVRPGDRADIVIGQGDFSRVLVNSPLNNVNLPNESGLRRPIGLVVDKNGDLFVADAGNSRVLRFPSPFSNAVPGVRQPANLVIGQANFTTILTDPSAQNLSYPYGVALSFEGHLLVSDTAHNRILFFRRPGGGDFTSGQSAEKVIGQPDFFTTAAGNSQNTGLNGPGHLALDTDDRLFATDPGNNRVFVYDRITVANNNPAPAFTLTGAGSPQGVWANPLTGEIWVTDFRGNRTLRYPRFELLALSTAPDYTIPSNNPIAVTQDGFGNLYVAEATNRVAIYFTALAAQSAGNFLATPLSPGAIGIVYPRSPGNPFGSETKTFNELPNPLPLPRMLGDIQVLVNDQPVPLYFISPQQINFLMPMSAPESGAVEVQVLEVSTGRVLAASQVAMQRYSPALFIANGQQQGQIAALNEDNTVNGADKPIPRGKVIQLFGTGQGRVPGAPEDGTPPSGQTSTADRPRVVINTGFVQDSDIQYSGLAPSLVGVWQINVRVPDMTPIGNAVPVVVQLGSQFSNGSGFLPGNNRLSTTIAVSAQ